MVPPPRDNDVTPRLRRPPKSSPNESSRFQPSGRGGCWTCRVRRKKCDEQWDGDSCSTCRRLEIVCLGSGPRRPDWLRDKHLVSRYRAQITETLTRAGRIRGQPRTPRRPAQTQPHSRPYQRESTESTWPEPREPTNQYNVDSAYHGSDIMFNSMIDTAFLPINNNDIGQSYFSYPVTSSTSTLPTPESYTFSLEERLGQEESFATLFPPTTLPFESSDGYIAYFTHYLSHVQSLQPMLVGNELVNLTNSIITRDPNGAVAKAVCALSSLHMAQLKISQGLEPLEPSMDHSTATYFRDEASFLINSSLQLHGRYTANDAIAALHLVSFSQLSGGQFPWQDAFGVLCDRVAQSALPSAENPCAQYENMSLVDQYIVKATLSLDVFASVSTGQSSRFLELMRRLLGEESHTWSPSDGDTRKIRMENFAGLPNNILLGIAEINGLSCWKSTEINNGSLSYRKLVHRGENIERLLQDQSFTAVALKEEAGAAGLPSAIEIGEKTQKVIVDIFREGALQYLNGVISGYNPDIPEIKESAKAVVNSLCELRPSFIDQSLVFPTLITACLTNDLEEREHLKGRLRMRGYSSQICMALDKVWRTRETAGGVVDIQGIVKDAGLLLI
ncbi:Fungal specific transcription factor domain containing protein [Amanita muscaria]